MDFKSRIISQLQLEGDLCLSASNYFKEPLTYIEKAVDLITDATLNALTGQFENLEKTDEMFKIGKECSVLRFKDFFGPDLYIVQKGRGINSEIFGVKLVHTIDEIAKEANVRNKTINFLMASTTPAILSLLHKLNEEKKFNPIDLFNQLKAKDLATKKAKKYAKTLTRYTKGLLKRTK
ncbi:hypothetical protein [Niabella ginsengisoli]|uniref:Uncharacterized protein n=1 Tax=Niabella ginsengisoli TaxID=522298 RepID=A0ABS9SQD6_9BACT|nr:hypothetical protein [Niabella ginsengisoli]MCH5600476.1 hypothetical protein [Niabella ginsengisoli]